MIFDGNVVALLLGTDIDTLVGQEAWLANTNALVLVQLAAISAPVAS